ncbi:MULTISPECIES: hypothetical protein, partial [Dyadobacter]|uniref:hypothetical protein n=1 Tax=Dyadobacter TaxID=120831 RepID=UPI00286D0976
VPEWQSIPANQATLTFQDIPDFKGSTSSGISIRQQSLIGLNRTSTRGVMGNRSFTTAQMELNRLKSQIFPLFETDGSPPNSDG